MAQDPPLVESKQRSRAIVGFLAHLQWRQYESHPPGTLSKNKVNCGPSCASGRSRDPSQEELEAYTAWTIPLDSPSSVAWSGDAFCDATVNWLRYLHRNVITQQGFDERVTQCTIYGKGV